MSTSWLRVIRRRLASLVLVVIGVSIITFAISHLVPGDPARLVAGDRATPEMVAHIRAQLGLDKPLLQQYGHYMWQLAHGDLGMSIRTRRPVLQDLAAFFPATLELALVALLLATLLGVPLGVLSAVYRNRVLDHIARTVAVTGVSTPAFWLGLGLIAIFYGNLGWFPGGGRLDGGMVAPPTITGMYLVDAVLTGNWALVPNIIKHLILPAITLGFVHLGIVARQIRSSMLDELGADYIRTMRAYGLSPWRVILGQALPNALIPSITMLGLAMGDLLYGAVLTETVFSWPGMGAYVVDSIQALDFPAVMGFAVVVSFVYVLLNLLVDLIYRWVDPRITEVG